MVWQSLRLDGEKFDKSKRWMYRKQKCNKATVCGLPSIHLPLTREASVVVRGEGDYCPFAMVVRVAVFGATGGASKARVLAIFEE